ncbi:MAG: helix-turn-helix transcriptional regulator [Sedimentisphaerales bacterium]|nr:helix-turn-helix transcriptional regulator [Sedimentisphaerales bacterium]
MMTVAALKNLETEDALVLPIEELDLSKRQGEIVRCLLRGKSDKQISAVLGISVPTVRTHMSRLFRKFGVNDRVELILLMLSRLRQGADKVGPMHTA